VREERRREREDERDDEDGCDTWTDETLTA